VHINRYIKFGIHMCLIVLSMVFLIACNKSSDYQIALTTKNEEKMEYEKIDTDQKKEQTKQSNELFDNPFKEKVDEATWKDGYFNIINHPETYDEFEEDGCWFGLVDVDFNQVPELIYTRYSGARGFYGPIYIYHYTNGELENFEIDSSSMRGTCYFFSVFENKETNERVFLFNSEFLDYEEWAIDLQELKIDLPNNMARTETIMQTGLVQYSPDRDLSLDEIKSIKEYLYIHEKVNYLSYELLHLMKYTESEFYVIESGSKSLLDEKIIRNFLDSWWSEL
jgi:hypothetical protein